MTQRLHNTWSRKLEAFEPLEAGKVRAYACGPTVYDYAHIGNFRFNVFVDIVRRTFEWLGYDVELVMNITDVDDKTIEGARRAGETLRTFTEGYTEAFFNDLDTLRILRADRYPRATDHIDDMVTMVETLLERGLAYRQGDSVFFRVAAFPDYGKLARLDPEALRSTGRVEGDDYGKEDARDFALWKAAKADEPAWDTPIGRGRPGWHLECSAMSIKYLGPAFDLHLGGVDLIFPHHENEIAQSVGATDAAFARYWLHCAHLVVDGTKMSKSLGNQYTLLELLVAGHDPVAIRYLLASVHYRKQLNFTFEALEQAAAAVARLRELVDRLEREGPGLPADGDDSTLAGELDAARTAFGAALADDWNTSGALGHVFSLVRAANAALDRAAATPKMAAAVLTWMRDIDGIWAVLPEGVEQVERAVEVDGVTLVACGPAIDEAALDLVVARMQARAERDFDRADSLRQELELRGVSLEDTAGGVRWQLAGSHRTTESTDS